MKAPRPHPSTLSTQILDLDQAGRLLDPARVNATHEDILHILKEIIQNAVTVQIKPIKPIAKLQNAVTVPKRTIKPIPKLQNAVTVPKTKKNNPSGVLETGSLGLRTPEGLVLLVFTKENQ